MEFNIAAGIFHPFATNIYGRNIIRKCNIYEEHIR